MNQQPVYDTLRLKQGEAEAILNELHREPAGPPASSRRAARRWRLGYQKIVVTLVDRMKTRTHHIAAPRTISVRGLGFLHGGFVHVGTPCSVTLRSLSGEARGIPGKVVRCSHITRNLHDIGVRFNHEINTADFIARGDECVFNVEYVDLAGLRGTVLVVNQDRADQKLTAQYLRTAPLTLSFVQDGASALQSIKDNPDILLVGSQLPDMTGLEFIDRARKQGYVLPIILFTADAQPGLRRMALDAGATELILQPCAPELLHQALAEYLHPAGGASAASDSGWIYSAADPRYITHELVVDYIEQLRRQADELADAVEKQHAGAIRSVSSSIKGASAGYGFPGITEIAEKVLETLGASGKLDRSLPAVQRLIGACLRAKPPRDGSAAA